MGLVSSLVGRPAPDFATERISKTAQVTDVNIGTADSGLGIL
jgi:hypothetical protein